MAFNIMIVDDSKVVHAVIEKALRMAEIPLGELHHAYNGTEGLEIVGDQWIDLIFADINMPVMNGEEMIEKLAESGVTERIPVVIISTEGSSTRLEHLKDKGVAAILRKPFQPEDFKTTIRNILGTTHA